MMDAQPFYFPISVKLLLACITHRFLRRAAFVF